MKIRAIVRKGVGEVEIAGRKLGPFREGEEVELEHWELRVLRRHGMAEPAQRMGIAELRKVLISEGKQAELSVLPEWFYHSVAGEIESLRREGKNEKANELRAALESFIEMRLHKLVKLALSPSEAKGALPEERMLLSRLSSCVEEWIEWLNERFERKEVGGIGARGNIPNVVGEKTDI